MTLRVLLASMALLNTAGVCGRELPPTIDQLRAASFSTSLEFERNLEPGPGFTAYLVSYRSAGLKVYAFVAVPAVPMPARGYPVLIANHGTHPDPARYGFTPEGVDSRPGNYYRSVPALFAAQGFMVVMPDYRGHNVSEGLEYARGFLASNYYAEDVLSLIAALPDLAHADLSNVFMWGHSLGGEVTLKVLLATDEVRGAALWSTVGGDIWEQAYHYSTRRRTGDPHDGSDVAKDAVMALRREIESLGAPWDFRDADPVRNLGYLGTPLILHHARDDEGAAFEWSRELAQELYRLDKPYVFYAYPGSDHFFADAQRQRAVDRDVQFFRRLMAVDE